MRLLNLAVAVVSLSVSAAIAQQGRPTTTDLPRYDIEGGYNYISANAPPGGCTNCFGLNGGFVSGGIHFTNWFSLAGQVTGTHASNISLLGQDLTLMTFMAGPHVSHQIHRFNPYAEALFGGARASDSYFPTREGGSSTSSATWAFSGGGGLDIDITRRIGIRAFDVQYLRTNFFNGNGSRQNQLQIGAGIQFKFGHRSSAPAPVVAMSAPTEIAFSCSANASNIIAGETVEFVGNAKTQPDQIPVTYTWSTQAGKLDGVGRSVTLNTAGMASGKYVVMGHVALTSNPSVGTDCATGFNVTYGPPQITCVASESNVVSGQPVTITVQEGPKTEPNTTYSYRTSAGDIKPSGKTATLDTTGVQTGNVTVRCRGVDPEGQISEATVNLNVVGSPDVSRKSAPTQLCSVSFKRRSNNPSRVNNEGKACLDEVALSLKRTPGAHLLMVGTSNAEPGSEKLAKMRARNSKNYLTGEQGIDPNRIQIRTSTAGVEKQVDNYLLQDGDSGASIEEIPSISKPMN